MSTTFTDSIPTASVIPNSGFGATDSPDPSDSTDSFSSTSFTPVPSPSSSDPGASSPPSSPTSTAFDTAAPPTDTPFPISSSQFVSSSTLPSSSSFIPSLVTPTPTAGNLLSHTVNGTGLSVLFIILIAIGGTLAIGALVFLIFWLRRRQKRARKSDFMGKDMGEYSSSGSSRRSYSHSRGDGSTSDQSGFAPLLRAGSNERPSAEYSLSSYAAIVSASDKPPTIPPGAVVSVTREALADSMAERGLAGRRSGDRPPTYAPALPSMLSRSVVARDLARDQPMDPEDRNTLISIDPVAKRLSLGTINTNSDIIPISPPSVLPRPNTGNSVVTRPNTGNSALVRPNTGNSMRSETTASIYSQQSASSSYFYRSNSDLARSGTKKSQKSVRQLLMERAQAMKVDEEEEDSMKRGSTAESLASRYEDAIDGEMPGNVFGIGAVRVQSPTDTLLHIHGVHGDIDFTSSSRVATPVATEPYPRIQ